MKKIKKNTDHKSQDKLLIKTSGRTNTKSEIEETKRDKQEANEIQTWKINSEN